MKKKIIQVPVIVGKGSEQFFVEKDVKISPPSPAIFKIENIERRCILPTLRNSGKVIFNAYIWKNVTYRLLRMSATELSMVRLFMLPSRSRLAGL